MTKPIKLFKAAIEVKTEEEYEAARLKYIAEYEQWEGGGLLSYGGYVSRPDVGEAKWNQLYPNGYTSWVGQSMATLNGMGQRLLIDKLNEVIKAQNKIIKQLEKDKK